MTKPPVCVSCENICTECYDEANDYIEYLEKLIKKKVGKEPGE